MRLIYFCSYVIEGENAGDPRHALRARTKREIDEAMDSVYGRTGYGAITRCEVEYSDGFNLASLCLGSIGPHWEDKAKNTTEPA